MVTKDDVTLHAINTKTKTGKDILKIYAAVNGYAVSKLVGFKSKKNDSQWVVSEDTEEEVEGKKLFTFFENTVGTKGSIVLKCPEITIEGLTLPLSGFLNTKYPEFDKYGTEFTSASLVYDDYTFNYYTNKVDDKYPKKYVLKSQHTYDNDTLKSVEDNCFKEFKDLKQTTFKYFFDKRAESSPTKEVVTTGVGF